MTRCHIVAGPNHFTARLVPEQAPRKCAASSLLGFEQEIIHVRSSALGS